MIFVVVTIAMQTKQNGKRYNDEFDDEITLWNSFKWQNSSKCSEHMSSYSVLQMDALVNMFASILAQYFLMEMLKMSWERGKSDQTEQFTKKIEFCSMLINFSIFHFFGLIHFKMFKCGPFQIKSNRIKPTTFEICTTHWITEIKCNVQNIAKCEMFTFGSRSKQMARYYGECVWHTPWSLVCRQKWKCICTALIRGRFDR